MAVCIYFLPVNYDLYAFKRTCDVNLPAPGFFRRIRHHHHKLRPVCHRDGQSLLARERSKARKQPVTVSLLLYFDKIVVCKRHIAHVVNRERLVEVFLVKAQFISQLAQKDTAFSGHGECVSVVSEIDSVNNAVHREGLRIKCDLVHFAAVIGIRLKNIRILCAVLEVHGLDLAFFRHIDCLFIRNIYTDCALGLNFLALGPDRDVKKASFRHAFIRSGLCAAQVGVILISAFLDLAHLELSVSRNLGFLVICHRHIIAGAVVDEFARGKDFLRSFLCCRLRCRFFRRLGRRRLRFLLCGCRLGSLLCGSRFIALLSGCVIDALVLGCFVYALLLGCVIGALVRGCIIYALLSGCVIGALVRGSFISALLSGCILVLGSICRYFFGGGLFIPGLL